MKILVIDTHVGGRADSTGWYGLSPNIEEYDAVIIDMQSLFQSTFDDIVRKNAEWQRIASARQEISTLLSTGREVFCIINEVITPSVRPGEFKGRHGGTPSNYDILPCCPQITKRKQGTSVSLIQERFGRYMQEVEKWEYEISAPRLIAIAKNKSSKLIAATARVGKGFIHFLPPPTKCSRSDAIDILLDMLLQPSTKTDPSWRTKLTIPGIGAVDQKISEVERQIQESSKQLEQLRIERARLDNFRDLVSPSGTGDYLESLVKAVLEQIGVNTTKSPKGYPIDLMGSELVFEVTGISKAITVSSEKYNQTLRFLEEYSKGEKVVIVANTSKNTEPSARPSPSFTKVVTKSLQSHHVCLITTLTLYHIWRAVSENKLQKEKAIQLLKDTDGELVLTA